MSVVILVLIILVAIFATVTLTGKLIEHGSADAPQMPEPEPWDMSYSPNVMIDLETVSLDKTAAIVSIGAVMFDPTTKQLGPEFYQNVELSSCVEFGLHVSQATIDWWAKPENREARDKLTTDAVPLDVAIDRFIEWCGNGVLADPEIIPWSNGAPFDIVILEHAIDTVGRTVPWKFYNESCYRTLKRLFPEIKVARISLKHDALEDAKHQATHCMEILNHIRLHPENLR